MKRRPAQQGGDPFARVARAADQAAAEVLEEDALLREYGIKPPDGRSR
jgi:hypothetical protein